MGGHRRHPYLVALQRQWQIFRDRGYIFDHASASIDCWDWMLCLLVLYTAIYLPMSLVFEGVRWNGDEIVDQVLDWIFILDIFIKFRTSYRDRGYEITDPWLVATHYYKGWFRIDTLASLPIEMIIKAAGVGGKADNSYWRLFKLLRMLRIGRLLRKLDTMNFTEGANMLRIGQMIFTLMLIAHWLGLAYFSLAIKPLHDQETSPDGVPWIWSDEYTDKDATALMYVCSLYWALSVMTNLKGLPAHESRQCFVESVVVVHPLWERIFTISTFLMGAIIYASLYGNIGRFLQNMDVSGQRHRLKLLEMSEFFRFHNVPPNLRSKIRAYMEFSFSVTRGINVEAIHSQLPAQLQLEVSVYLNMQMLEQVPIFKGLPQKFIKALVVLMQTCICIGGDTVFNAGDHGDRMYFVKRGMLKVLAPNGVDVLRTVKEGDFFGEVALFTKNPRNATIVAVTDCVLLALHRRSFETALDTGGNEEVRSMIGWAVKREYQDIMAKQGWDLKEFGLVADEEQKASDSRFGSLRRPSVCGLGRRMSCQGRGSIGMGRRGSIGLGGVIGRVAMRRSSSARGSEEAEEEAAARIQAVARGNSQRKSGRSRWSSKRASSRKSSSRRSNGESVKSDDSGREAEQDAQPNSETQPTSDVPSTSDGEHLAAARIQAVMRGNTQRLALRNTGAQGPEGALSVLSAIDEDDASAHSSQPQAQPTSTSTSIRDANEAATRIQAVQRGSSWRLKMTPAGTLSGVGVTAVQTKVALSLQDPMQAAIEQQMMRRRSNTPSVDTVLMQARRRSRRDSDSSTSSGRGGHTEKRRASHDEDDEEPPPPPPPPPPRSTCEKVRSTPRRGSLMPSCGDSLSREILQGRDGRDGDTATALDKEEASFPRKDKVQQMNMNMTEGGMLMGHERISHAMDVGRLDRRIGQQTLALNEAIRHAEKRICEFVMEVQLRQDDRMNRLARDIEKILGVVRDTDRTSATSL